MSKLSDYSKFDHIDEGSSSDEEVHPTEATTATRAAGASPPPQQQHGGVTRKEGSIEGRYVFEYDGQKIYEWEQTLEDVTLYVEVPKDQGIQAHHMDCQISTRHFRLGIKGRNSCFIDEDTFGKVDTSESSWYLDDNGILTVILAKAHRGETWASALSGPFTENPVLQQEMQKQLLLERFQEENPGMDFRGANVNGQVPDPRTFMGGIKYS